MGTKSINITQLSDKIDFGVPYSNIYIFNDGGSGYIRINETTKLDIEKVKKAEDLKIRTVEWNLSTIGNGVSILLSTEKLDINDLSITLLSRLYSELQKKQNKKKIVYVDASSSTTVSAGSSETITIIPPSGKIWRVVTGWLRVGAVPSSTTGSHWWAVIMNGQTEWTSGLRVSAAYNGAIEIKSFMPTSGTIADGVTRDEFTAAVRYLRFSNSLPLSLKYTNSTDADQTTSRAIRLIVEEEDEAT